MKDKDEYKEVISQRIIDKSRIHYDHMVKNLAKIEEKYQDNPVLLRQQTRNYMEHISENVKKAKNNIDKTSEGIRSKIPSYLNTSRQSLNKAVESIDNYAIEGVNIGEHDDVVSTPSPLLGDKIRILKHVKDFSLGA